MNMFDLEELLRRLDDLYGALLMEELEKLEHSKYKNGKRQSRKEDDK
jgi:hypothetical protein